MTFMDDIAKVTNPCPCKREGKGCINYTVQDHAPHYVCRFTTGEAYVPNDGEVGEYRIFGLMDD